MKNAFEELNGAENQEPDKHDKEHIESNQDKLVNNERDSTKRKNRHKKSHAHIKDQQSMHTSQTTYIYRIIQHTNNVLRLV